MLKYSTLKMMYKNMYFQSYEADIKLKEFIKNTLNNKHSLNLYILDLIHDCKLMKNDKDKSLLNQYTSSIKDLLHYEKNN